LEKKQKKIKSAILLSHPTHNAGWDFAVLHKIQHRRNLADYKDFALAVEQVYT